MCAAELHIISNGKQPLSQFARIAGAVHDYATAIHVREKALGAQELWQGIQCLRAAGVPSAKIVINDRADVAWAAGAGGVQLAGHSLETIAVKCAFPGLRIGRSVHCLAEAAKSERQGADYLVFGHIFSTAAKRGMPPQGLEALRQVAGHAGIPVIAIGGIKAEHVRSVMAAGAAGIAVMSGIVEAADPLAAAKQYARYLREEENRDGDSI